MIGRSVSDPGGVSSLPIRSGHCSEQGVRPTMEDEVCVADHFYVGQSGNYSFFGVFDGHGGRQAAIFTRDHLLEILKAELEQGVEPTAALHNAYIKTDNMFISACKGQSEAANAPAPPVAPPSPALPQLPAAATGHRRQNSAHLAVKIPIASLPPALPPVAQAATARSASAAVPSSTHQQPDVAPMTDNSGTTAVSILLHHDTYTLYVANVGDSRAVLSNSDGTVVSLTNDHKADRPDEVDRIRRAGGFVVHKRVMGELAISRAIGDIDFKSLGEAFVIADPEITVQPLSAQVDFILLACDGLYDVMSNEQACQFVRDCLTRGMTPDQAARVIVKHAIEKLNTRDNVTAVIAKLPSAEELRNHNVQPNSPKPLALIGHASSTPHVFPTTASQPKQQLSQSSSSATNGAQQRAMPPLHPSKLAPVSVDAAPRTAATAHSSTAATPAGQQNGTPLASPATAAATGSLPSPAPLQSLHHTSPQATLSPFVASAVPTVVPVTAYSQPVASTAAAVGVRSPQSAHRPSVSGSHHSSLQDSDIRFHDGDDDVTMDGAAEPASSPSDAAAAAAAKDDKRIHSTA